MSTATALIAAEEYAKMGDSDRPTELVRGRIVEGTFPPPKHGYVCCNAGVILGNFVRENELGRVIVNAGLITEREPDTVRGPDVWYASYRKMPQGRVSNFYFEAAPDLVIEVLSPDDRWNGWLNFWNSAWRSSACSILSRRRLNYFIPTNRASKICRPTMS